MARRRATSNSTTSNPVASNPVASNPVASNPEPAPAVLAGSDLRGIVGLVQGATAGVLTITEGVHQSVRSTLALSSGAEPDRAGGLTGRIYAALRGFNAGVGHGLQGALGLLEQRLLRAPQAEPHPVRLALLSALNGVLGDRLQAERNPLALAMQLRLGGMPFDEAVLGPADSLRPHALVLIHGLCMNDLQWASSADRGHGEAMAAALGCTPIYLRYNSGLSIAQNGIALAHALQHLQARWPLPLQRISLLGHSMGGLIARSAELHARQLDMSWRSQLRDLLLLGTPNLGAPLERAGYGIDQLLGSLPYARHFARLGQMRSAGITDLRHGHLSADASPVALPADLGCYAVAGVLAKRRSPMSERLLGDGLVPLHSALGTGESGGPALDIPEHRTQVLYGTGHLDLLRSPAARQRMIDWLRD